MSVIGTISMDLKHETPKSSGLQLARVSQALFESAAEGLIVIDARGKMVLLNQRACEMLGYLEEELIGAQIEMLVPMKLAGAHQKLREGFVQEPSRRSMGIGRDLCARRKDGSEFPVEISLNHFENEGDRYVMALLSDITQRKTTEQELEKLNQELEHRVQLRTRELAESQNLYAVIARNFPNGIIMVFDQDFNYVFAEGRELFKMGVTSDELVGTNYLTRLGEGVRDTIEQHLRTVFEGQNANFDMIVDDKHYELHAVPLRDSTGLVTRILVVETNVTQQKRAEKNMLKTLDKERQLNELKSRFVAMASHEFRTPLSTILTSLSLVARYTAPEQEANRLKHYNRIRSSVHNLTGILNDFLSLDKLETGMIATNPEQIELRTFLEDMVDELQSLCKDGQIISLQFENDGIVKADKNMLRNIVMNLISNALKYSGENQAVEVKVAFKDAKVYVSVIDHGIGIPEADQLHMFERFFRAHNATNIQGTGLGLNIVKKYLDLMGGDIWFESTLGNGSIFNFVLPQNDAQ
jgi:PAS domain S-box-containing protein